MQIVSHETLLKTGGVFPPEILNKRGDNFLKLSRGANICYDLDKSPYKITLGDLTFHFSSEMHKIKFLEKFETHRTKISESLSNRFNIHISFNILSDLVLYRAIETRGFYVTDNRGDDYSKLNLIRLKGVKG